MLFCFDDIGANIRLLSIMKSWLFLVGVNSAAFSFIIYVEACKCISSNRLD